MTLKVYIYVSDLRAEEGQVDEEVLDSGLFWPHTL